MANVRASVLNETGALLKRFYAGPIVNQLNEDLPTYKMCEKIKDQGSGEAVYPILRTSRNQGIGSGTDGGVLPAMGKQGYTQPVVPWRYNWLRTGLTAGVIAASRRDVGAFGSVVKENIDGAYKDFANDFNRQLSFTGTGYLGALSAAVVASNTLSVIGRENNTTSPGNQFLFPDMIVDVVTTAGVYKIQGATILSVSGTTTATVVLDQAITAAVGDRIVRANSYNNDVNGLLYSLDGGTGTIYSVDRSTVTSFQGNVLDVGGGQLTIDNMQNAFNEGLRRGGKANGRYRAALMDFDSSRFYQKLISPDKRYVNTQKMDGGGWDKTDLAMEFNGLPITVDKDFPQRIMFAPIDVLRFYILNEMEMADESGSNMIPDSEVDQFEIRFRMFGNLFNAQPSAWGVLTNYISP